MRKVLRILGVLGGLAGVIWAMRDRFISISAPREPVPIPPLPGVERAQVQQEPAADDLTVIVGIGPTIAARLNQAGITSLAAMMASSPERVAAAAKVSEERASGWMKQAAVLQA